MSTNNRTSRRVDLLFERLVVNPPEALLKNDQNEVNDEVLVEFKIRRLGMDLESSEILRSVHFFTPMAPEELIKHPIRLDLLEEDVASNLDFPDYNPPANEDGHQSVYWNARTCSRIVLDYFIDYLLGGFPRDLPLCVLSLAHKRQLNRISMPNPFLLGGALQGAYPTVRDAWTAGLKLEPERDNNRVYPHVILGASQSFDGHEGEMLFGELAPIITAMYNRAHQPQVPNEDQESMFDAPEEIAQHDLQFPDEVHFPVILISFVGPQHGRIFCGYMNVGELIIHQSKLYSFERKESAPFDLFASFALSQPVVVRETVWL